MRWVNSRMYTFTSTWLDFDYIISVFACVFRCVITAPLAGCPLTLKPISWVSVQLWPSEDFSSTSLEPMKEVMQWQKLFGEKKSAIERCFWSCTCVCRHSDGDDGPCSCQDPRGDQNVGACCLHTQLPTASSLSGQAASAHEWQGELCLSGESVVGRFQVCPWLSWS